MLLHPVDTKDTFGTAAAAAADAAASAAASAAACAAAATPTETLLAAALSFHVTSTRKPEASLLVKASNSSS